jgi:hypothetical protein
MGEYSPEKAGVGGSTPSLATIKSITSKHRKRQLCPNLSQKIEKLAEEFASDFLYARSPGIYLKALMT